MKQSVSMLGTFSKDILETFILVIHSLNAFKPKHLYSKVERRRYLLDKVSTPLFLFAGLVVDHEMEGL